MSCHTCKVILVPDELKKKIKCDTCANLFCQACSGFSASEVRVMQLQGQRRLRFECCVCEETCPSSDGAAKLHGEIMWLSRSLSDSFSQSLEVVKLGFQEKLDNLVQQVNDLRETNIQLLHFAFPHRGLPTPSTGATSSTGSAVLNSPPKDVTSVNTKSTVKTGTLVATAKHSSKSIESGETSRHVSLRKITPQASRNPVVTGVRIGGSKSISAATIVKKTSIAVSRLSLNTSESQLENYLKDTFGADETFKIEKMTVQSGDYNCFRVEAKAELLGSLLDPQNWIEGVSVRKFRFFRGYQTGSVHQS